jgi:hypothetical protein
VKIKIGAPKRAIYLSIVMALVSSLLSFIATPAIAAVSRTTLEILARVVERSTTTHLVVLIVGLHNLTLVTILKLLQAHGAVLQIH